MPATRMSEPRIGTPNTSTAKPRNAADFDDQHREPRDQERQQEVVTRHRSRDEPLHQLAPPRVDDGEAHAPDRPAHEVHAEQPRHEEVDVARPRLAHQLLARRHGIHSAGTLLHREIRAHPRVSPLRIRVVVVVDDGARGGALDEQRDSPFAERTQAFLERRERIDGERRRVLERRRGPSRRSRWKPLRPARCETPAPSPLRAAAESRRPRTALPARAGTRETGRASAARADG